MAEIALVLPDGFVEGRKVAEFTFGAGESSVPPLTMKSPGSTRGGMVR